MKQRRLTLVNQQGLELAAEGIAALCFDIIGLRQSRGDFA